MRISTGVQASLGYSLTGLMMAFLTEVMILLRLDHGAVVVINPESLVGRGRDVVVRSGGDMYLLFNWVALHHEVLVFCLAA